MTSATRHICLAVLLGLLVSHAGVAMHAATHVPDDGVDCELCFSFGDSSSAVAAVHEQDLPDCHEQRRPAIADSIIETQQTLSFLPRGPPASA